MPDAVPGEAREASAKRLLDQTRAQVIHLYRALGKVATAVVVYDAGPEDDGEAREAFALAVSTLERIEQMVSDAGGHLEIAARGKGAGDGTA